MTLIKNNVLIFVVFLLTWDLGSTASSPSNSEVIDGSISVDVSDKKSLQRGARNFFNYCAGCHALKYMRYGEIAEDLNISEDQLLNNLIFTNKTPQDTVNTNMLKADGDRWFVRSICYYLRIGRGRDWTAW